MPWPNRKKIISVLHIFYTTLQYIAQWWLWRSLWDMNNIFAAFFFVLFLFLFVFFLSICLPHGQLWTIINESVSLIRSESLRFYQFPTRRSTLASWRGWVRKPDQAPRIYIIKGIFNTAEVSPNNDCLMTSWIKNIFTVKK